MNKLLVVGAPVVDELPEDPPESGVELGIDVVVVAFGDMDCVEGICVVVGEDATTGLLVASVSYI